MTVPFEDVDPVRRRIMSAVRSSDTKPEMIVRRLLFSMKYRYRLHSKDLPGRPDLVFAARRKVIFVHGCFWHRHPGCAKASFPKKRAEFWAEKFDANIKRDLIVEEQLARLGWSIVTIWECETRDPDCMASKLRRFLDAEANDPLKTQEQRAL